MSQKNIRRRLSMTFALATLFAVQPAAADSLKFDGFYYSGTPSNYSGTDTVYIKDTATANAFGSVTDLNPAEHVYSGGFKMTDTSGTTLPTGTSFMAWCIDIHDNMKSATYTLKTDENYIPSAHIPLGITQQVSLERLASIAVVNNAQTSSAFQLAAWEIMAEQSGTYSLLSGNFTAYSSALNAIGNNATAGTAEYWLSHLGTAVRTMELSIWSADTRQSTQDLAVFAPVPEPETYAMMLAGLGLMGFVARRRNQHADA